MITKKFLILLVLLIVLTTGFFGRKRINWVFFTYNHEKCLARVVDDCIEIINRIDPNTKIKDLTSLDYCKLKTVIDLPEISKRVEVFPEEKVSDVISLPLEFNNEEIRRKVEKKNAVNRMTDKWCERPAFLRD